jgi:hypothetical protein
MSRAAFISILTIKFFVILIPLYTPHHLMGIIIDAGNLLQPNNLPTGFELPKTSTPLKMALKHPVRGCFTYGINTPPLI